MCLGKAELAPALALWFQGYGCFLMLLMPRAMGASVWGQGSEAHLAAFISSVAVGQAVSSPMPQGQWRVPSEHWLCGNTPTLLGLFILSL